MHRCPRGPRGVPAVQGPVASAPEPGPAGRALLLPGQGASSQAAPAYLQARRGAGGGPKEGCVLSLQEDRPTGPCARPAGKGLTPVRAWLLSSHWQHPSCSTGRAHSSAPATLAPAVPASCLRACARCPVPLCCPTLCRTGGVSVRAPRPPTLACKTGRTTPPAGPPSTRPDLCPAGAPCTGASHGQRGCNGWAGTGPSPGLQSRVLRRAPGSPARASALHICSWPGGDSNPSRPCAAALCPPGNGSALPAGPLLAPWDGRGQCRPSWGGPLVAWMGMRSSGRPVGAPSPRTTGRPPLLSRDAPRRQGPQEALTRQARSPRADAPCLLARPRLPGRPTLRRTVCRWMTRGPLGPPVSAHVMRGEHTLLRASSLLPGLASGLGGPPPCGAPLPPWMPCRRWGASVHWPYRCAAQSRWVSWRRPPLQGAVCPCVPARP